ncbi:methionine ABC transporter ATP-binding protein [Furfurilactobacillus siliginis]|uniref:ABC-type metal ion transport system, ATPase component n=1 Tax=Furfurilactobacillus siliginis TaxID=348151 RepID=A0A0R2L3F9_9LACO|nr:methionine ABC transporter ATP-binding protein [Furfurilactobacillus siliginis]KRN96146.1 ABC-type metal ion transport system, ATPase component [Furfurilactobacillus siliginis]GEK27930.1 methionine import ATP-binding protein MetN [Furfurilactobacillus siliginis]
MAEATSPIIELKDIDVTFKEADRTVKAVKDVNLQVNKGDIYGIVGYSGAGKSTLVRVINQLQRQSKGTVTVSGQNLGNLSGKNLRQARTKIGMIFQHFNLMNERTIGDNVLFPLLLGSKLTRKEKQAKVDELLDLVGLADKKNDYPAQLSGGQKQRVAIARALANDPEILISDEATSALDPKTTGAILELLKHLNETLGLTVVLITHEMQAVKAICNKVAVMQSGEIIERGDLLTIFSNPTEQLTKEFIETSSQIDSALANVVEQATVQNLGAGEQLVVLSYAGDSTEAPLIAQLYEKFHVTPNILFGNVEILQNTPVGTLGLVLSGVGDAVETALAYVAQQGVHVRRINVAEYRAELARKAAANNEEATV